MKTAWIIAAGKKPQEIDAAAYAKLLYQNPDLALSAALSKDKAGTIPVKFVPRYIQKSDRKETRRAHFALASGGYCGPKVKSISRDHSPF